MGLSQSLTIRILSSCLSIGRMRTTSSAVDGMTGVSRDPVGLASPVVPDTIASVIFSGTLTANVVRVCSEADECKPSGSVSVPDVN